MEHKLMTTLPRAQWHHSGPDRYERGPLRVASRILKLLCDETTFGLQHKTLNMRSFLDLPYCLDLRQHRPLKRCHRPEMAGPSQKHRKEPTSL